MGYDGLIGPYEGNSLGTKVAIATFIGISWYNAIELCVLLFVTFERYQGLYFWSLLITGVAGVLPYSVAYLIKFFNLVETPWLFVALSTVGWWCMVTGQSFVLYSRLHLLQRDRKILRRVLFVILADVVLLHVPTTVLTIGSNSGAGHKFLTAYSVMERIQMTGFFLQEFLLSTLYIIEAIKLLRLSPHGGNRKLMLQLLSINLIFIIMDMGLLGAAYASLYAIETTLKATIYSIKLKLEFAVLGKLVRLVRGHSWDPNFSNGPNGLPDFVDASRLTTDVTRAPVSPNAPPKLPWELTDDAEVMVTGQHDKSERGASQTAGSTQSRTWSTRCSESSATSETPIDFTVPGVLPSPRNSRSNNPNWPLP